jgi:hypothetical protein
MGFVFQVERIENKSGQEDDTGDDIHPVFAEELSHLRIHKL